MIQEHHIFSEYHYLLLLRDKAEKANPINNIISEIKSLKSD